MRLQRGLRGLCHPVGARGLRFGSALSGDTAVIGAPQDDDLGADSGSAYVFFIGDLKGNGEPCMDGAECASGSCVDGVCCDAGCGGGDPGDCQACSVPMGAAVDGTCAPLMGGTECRASARACDVAEACDGAMSECPVDAQAPDGAPCQGGVCKSGACEPGTGGSGGADGSGGGGVGGSGVGGSGGGGVGGSGGAGGSGDAGGDGSGGTIAEGSGCDCSTVGGSPDGSAGRVLCLLGLGLLAVRARRAGSPRRRCPT